jgi:hypothetical protein
MLDAIRSPDEKPEPGDMTPAVCYTTAHKRDMLFVVLQQ